MTTTSALIQIFVATLCLACVSSAYASSADPMSRDVEFRENLGRQDNSRELGASIPVSRFLRGTLMYRKRNRTPR